VISGIHAQNILLIARGIFCELNAKDDSSILCDEGRMVIASECRLVTTVKARQIEAA